MARDDSVKDWPTDALVATGCSVKTGGFTTLKFAIFERLLPNELLTSTVYAPASDIVTFANTYDIDVAPTIFVPPFFH